MESSYFMISNNTPTTTTTTTNASQINNELEQSSSLSPFSYDPFDGFPFLDQQQQGMRLYDYFNGAGRCSPLMNQYPLDHLDQLKNSPFRVDSNQDDDDDLQGTLTSFVGDLGAESDAGYTSGVDLFSTNSIVDCSESPEAYCFRFSLDQTSSCNITNGYINNNNGHNFSDINNNLNNNINNYYNNNNFNNYDCNGDRNNTSHDSNTEKRSVLMNLLIDGSDVGAGYTSINCRALQSYQQQRSSSSNNNIS